MRELSQSRSLLATRRTELYAYLDYLRRVESIRFQQTHAANLPPSDVEAMMKATILIMNYSLVEATMVEILYEVFEKIQAGGSTLKTVSEGVRSQLVYYRIKDLRDAGIGKVEEYVREMIQSAIDSKPIWTPDKKYIRNGFLGNLDALKIRDVSDKMGIRVVAARRTRNGYDLKEMKDSRNYLAHGHTSFVDLGQTKGVTDLEHQCDRVVEYLLAVIRAYEKQIRSGKLCSQISG